MKIVTDHQIHKAVQELLEENPGQYLVSEYIAHMVCRVTEVTPGEYLSLVARTKRYLSRSVKKASGLIGVKLGRGYYLRKHEHMFALAKSLDENLKVYAGITINLPFLSHQTYRGLPDSIRAKCEWKFYTDEIEKLVQSRIKQGQLKEGSRGGIMIPSAHG